MIRPLCVEPHPTLRTAAARIEHFNADLRRLVRDMIDTMYANDGVGLAAPQIGHSVQVFVASPTRNRGEEVVMINPSLERASGRSAVVEGCLSLPDTWSKVRRSAQVRIRGMDLEGSAQVVDTGGLLAIILQHEMDHLQGCLFVDRLPWWRRATVKKKR